MKQKKESNTIENSAIQNALKRALNSLVSAPAYKNPEAAYIATISELQDDTPVEEKQWEQLYEVAKNIRLLAPWEHLNDSQRITLLLSDRDEPVYIVVMGNGGMTYGIGIYYGYDSLRRLLKLNESEIDENNMTVAFEQRCINLYFGDREELELRDKKVIKQLGLKFRGKNEWPYFRSMKPGFMPWYINRDEAELAISALQNFAMAFLAYSKISFKTDFQSGETFLRFYDVDSAMWYNTAMKMPLIPFIIPKMIITNDVLMAQLKKKKRNQAKIGLIITYISMPVLENKDERPKMPRIAILVDMEKGMIIDQAMDIGDIGSAVIDLLTSYIKNNGRPEFFAVMDDYTGDYIEDFATKLEIKLVEDKRLIAISNLILEQFDKFDNIT